MRSELVYGATTYVPNRYLLTRLAAKATRRFHRPCTRLEETTNEVLDRFSHTNPIAGVGSVRVSRGPAAVTPMQGKQSANQRIEPE